MSREDETTETTETKNLQTDLIPPLKVGFHIHAQHFDAPAVARPGSARYFPRRHKPVKMGTAALNQFTCLPPVQSFRQTFKAGHSVIS